MNHLATRPGYFRLPVASAVFSLLLFFIFFSASAQNLNVQGKVTTEQGTPLANAQVINTTINTAAVTDQNGTFTIECGPTAHLVIYTDGYEMAVLDVNANSTIPDITLKKITELTEVVIERNLQKRSAIGYLKDIDGTNIYAGKKSEVVTVDRLVANKAVGTMRQIYAQVVGLTFNEGAEGGLQLNIGGRGLNPNRTSNFNTRQNGYDISADVLGYPESYYTPPAEGVEKIQVVRGAASLQYGTQFGGLVNFIMHQPSKKPIEVVQRNTLGSYGLFTNFSSVSGTEKKFSFYTFFNYKQGNGFRPNANFNSRNFFINLNYAFTEKTALHFDYTLFDYLAKQPGGLTDLMFHQNMLQSNRTRNWFGVNWNLFNLKLEHKFTENANFNVQFFGLNASRETVGYLSNRVSGADPGEGRDLIKGKFVNWGAEAKFLQQYTINNQKSAFLIGAKYYQAQNTGYQGPGSAGSDANFTPATVDFPSYANQSDYKYPNLNVALFAENIFRLSPKFTITPGLRYENINTKSKGYWRHINTDLAGNVILDERLDENVTKNRNFFLAGIGLSYKPTQKAELYANISQNYRSVTFSDIRTATPGLVIDPNITDEKGFTSDIGLRGKIDDRFSYDTNVYALLYNDKIGEYQRVNPNGGGAVVRYRSNIGTAITYGWEALGDWNISNTFFKQNDNFLWTLFVNNAITDSRYLKTDAPNIKGNKVEFVPTINLKTGTTVGWGNFKASAQVMYVSQQFTDSNNSTANETENTFGVFGQIPSYYVADVSASYTWRCIKLEAGVNNLTNNYYFTRRATGYPGPGILPSEPRTFYTTLQIKL
ncbi:TonB-dependent receptor domain-containing protein [Flavobacterium sp. RNTU_13]|uniref:TonB-dependent receptor domain-containing protein n=1 Tax=Flavobacterium sp. RNTU_13 TaxID=3375145 RepID=UPI0039888DC8